MPVQFSEEARSQAVESLRRYCTEELDLDVTAIQAATLLKFILAEIAPTAYNAGVATAEAFLRGWPKGASVRRRR